MIANFRTPVMHKGSYTLNFCIVCKNYLNNGLIIDLFGLSPFNVIFGYAEHEKYMVINTIFMIIRILAVARIIVLFERFEVFMKNLNVLIFITKAVMILFFLWHWTACVWAFINIKVDPLYYETYWLNEFNLE